MATTATAIGTLPLRRPNLIAICVKEAKYEFLKCLRLPMYSVSTLVFPLMFYVLFGLVMGKQTIGHISTTVYLIPAYGTFAVMGASLFGTAAGLASERGLGWLQVKRASPMPLVAYFLAKVVMSLIFSTIDVSALMVLGMTFGGVHLGALTAAKLLGTLVAGSIPFCAMGLGIGYLATPNSAPAVINLFYLPIPASLCAKDRARVAPLSFVATRVQRRGCRPGWSDGNSLADLGGIYVDLPGCSVGGTSTRPKSKWIASCVRNGQQGF
jgi:ABC-2 type transport system permease protein